MVANNYIRFGILGRMCISAIVMTLTGCTPNYRSFDKQNIELSATLSGGEANYRTLSVGTRSQPFDQNLDLYGDLIVELSNDERISLADLSVAKAEKSASKVRNLDEVGYDTGWPKGSKRLKLGSRLFVTVNGDRILEVSANAVGLKADENPPRFGKRPDSLYSMPFSHEQVLELFGKPDKLIDEWRR